MTQPIIDSENGARSDGAEPAVVRLSGSVDLEHAPEVRKSLLAAVSRWRELLIDLSEVAYIDSSGIACLVEALQKARAEDREFGLVAVSRQAMRVLELARLDMVFPIHDDLAAARAARG